jgi:hypothetical protein
LRHQTKPFIIDFTMTEPAPPETVDKRHPWRAAMLALGFAVFFLLLRSQQYTAVDGPLRSLTVFHDPTQRFHGNNHLLYPFWIWLWTRTAALVGLTAHDWLAFIRQCQAMNAVCAAAAIGMLFSVLEAIAGTRFALLGSLQFGLSTAVVLHATNAAEPVTGLFFALSALGVLIPALRAESKIGLFLVGILLTLALASYQSMALVAPMVAFACVCWPGTRWRLAVTRLVFVGAGGLLSVITIYGLAYSSLGIPPKRMLARFVALEGGQVYGGFRLSNLVNVPFGLIRNLFFAVPSNYAGIRSLFRDPHAASWISLDAVSLILLAAFACLVGAGIISAVRRSSVSKPLLWSAILVSALAVSFPLFYWDPKYDKLWLLPLAAIAIAVAFAFRFGDLSGIQRKFLTSGLVLLLIAEAAVNIPLTVQAHRHETAHLDDARDLAALVNSGDSVVVDFDDVSSLWAAIFGYGINKINLPASTHSEAVEWLGKAETTKTGTLLFVGILDQDRSNWDGFLGRATGLSYADFDCYRQKSVILRRYSLPEGSVTVRQLQPPFSCKGFAGMATKPRETVGTSTRND